MDGTDFEGRIKNFDRFAVIVEHSGADHMVFKHAIATIRSPRTDEQLLLLPRGLIRRAAGARSGDCRGPSASSSSCSTASASASCPTPHATATRAATRSATSRGTFRCACPTLRRLGLVASPCRPAIGAEPTPLGAFGRMAEASPGKDSVTGHWELMGLVLDRPFPTFPHGFPARPHRRRSSAHRPRHARQQGRLGHRDHRRARARAHAHRQADRLHVGRQRVPDRRARGRRAGAGALSHAARSPTSWSAKGLGVGRVIARPFVGASGRVSRARPTGTTSRCRRSRRRCSIG